MSAETLGLTHGLLNGDAAGVSSVLGGPTDAVQQEPDDAGLCGVVVGVELLDVGGQAVTFGRRSVRSGASSARRVAAIVVSHDLGVVRLLADRTLVMRHGRVVESGLTDRITEDPHHEYTQALLNSVV